MSNGYMREITGACRSPTHEVVAVGATQHEGGSFAEPGARLAGDDERFGEERVGAIVVALLLGVAAVDDEVADFVGQVGGGAHGLMVAGHADVGRVPQTTYAAPSGPVQTWTSASRVSRWLHGRSNPSKVVMHRRAENHTTGLSSTFQRGAHLLPSATTRPPSRTCPSTLSIVAGVRSTSCARANSAASAIVGKPASSTDDSTKVMLRHTAFAARSRACASISGLWSIATIVPVGPTVRSRSTKLSPVPQQTSMTVSPVLNARRRTARARTTRPLSAFRS